jgi:hypothetical protein
VDGGRSIRLCVVLVGSFIGSCFISCSFVSDSFVISSGGGIGI